MNKKAIILIGFTLAVALLFALLAFADNGEKSSSALNLNASRPGSVEIKEGASPSPVSAENIPSDRIEVVHFHGTHQCWSCSTVGEYALQTIRDKFPEEYQSGKIIFKDINGELPENKEIVVKYQARGSSLFINAIRADEDKIEEDTTVWRLVSDQQEFTNYFEKKLKGLLSE